jgi:hypothetical protein
MQSADYHFTDFFPLIFGKLALLYFGILRYSLVLSRVYYVSIVILGLGV